MYDYRRMSAERRATLVEELKNRGFPWHSPPHPELPGEFRIVTAACYEHQRILDTPERLRWFEDELLGCIKNLAIVCAAWCILPNHYHVLVKIDKMKEFMRSLGRLHGRTSFTMNAEDNERGRQVWCRAQDRCMRSEGHYYTSLNYVHNNPVKHGYVEKWQDWPFSSVHWYLKNKGRAWLLDLWLEYPVLNYGEKWDP